MARSVVLRTLFGVSLGLLVMTVAVVVARTPNRSSVVDEVSWLAILAGVLAVAVAIGAWYSDRRTDSWQQITVGAVAAPLLVLIPVYPVLRILGPAVQALTVIPQVLSANALRGWPARRLAVSCIGAAIVV